MFYSDNPEMDFIRYDAHQERELKKRPVCEKCKEPITDDYLYEIDELTLCSECFTKYCKDNFRRSINVD